MGPQLQNFPPHERLSMASVARDLVGEDRPELCAIVLAELRHRIGLKLSLGQRVAVALDGLSNTDKQHLVSLATSQGAEVIDLIERPDVVQPVPALPSDVYGHLRSAWKGITVVGDLHGDLTAFSLALDWAQARQNFLWLLGDVIDYGQETLATADAVYHAVMAGTAALILGNHERKIARWLDQGGKHRVNEGNRVTIDALERLDSVSKRRWIGRFRSLLGHAALMQQLGNVTLVHAATHPSLWTAQPDHALIEQFALYGEGDHSTGRFRRVHHWIDHVPQDQLVLVGHDCIAEFPVVLTGALGGQVVFLDTGCGTGGYLSTADLRFNETGLRLECFNRH
jgi:hypothetical protein